MFYSFFFIKTELGEVKVMFKLNHLSLKMPNKQGLKKYMWNTRLSPFPSTKVQFVLIGSNLVNNWVSAFGMCKLITRAEFFFIYKYIYSVFDIYGTIQVGVFFYFLSIDTLIKESNAFYKEPSWPDFLSRIRNVWAVVTLSTIGPYIYLCHWLNMLNVLIHSKFYSYK